MPDPSATPPAPETAAGRRTLVRPGFGPTLPALLAGRGIPPRLTIAGVVAVVAVVVAAVLLLRDPLDGRTQYVHRDAPVFNLLYAGGLERAATQGDELVRLTGQRGGSRVQLTVRPYRLPAYRGDVAGILPIAMTNLAARYDLPGLRVTGDGKGRISAAPGYQNEFTYTVPGGGRGYGLDVLVVPPEQPTARDGLLISLRQTRGARRPRPAGRLLTAAARSSLRSLRFGTELTYPD